MSPRTRARRSAACRLLMLRAATGRAPVLYSSSRPRLCGSSRASVMPMQPVPVPRSAKRTSLCPSHSRSTISSSSSVSGRGMSVCGLTSKSRPKNSRRPVMWASGSPAQRRAVRARMAAAASSATGEGMASIRPMRSRCSTWPASRRASSAGASVPAACRSRVSEVSSS